MASISSASYGLNRVPRSESRMDSWTVSRFAVRPEHRHETTAMVALRRGRVGEHTGGSPASSLHVNAHAHADSHRQASPSSGPTKGRLVHLRHQMYESFIDRSCAYRQTSCSLRPVLTSKVRAIAHDHAADNGFKSRSIIMRIQPGYRKRRILLCWGGQSR